MSTLTLIVIVVSVLAGTTIGLLAGAWCCAIAHRDDDLVAHRALLCVMQENGGLSEQTRAIVINAIAEHESRNAVDRKQHS